jgi:Flp pilus assembly protein TadD
MDQEEIRNVNWLIREGEHELVAKQYERALDYFRKAYEMNSKNATTIVNMGFCYAKLGKFQHAQKCFTTALDLNPHNIVARRNLGRILRPQGISYPDPFKKSVPDKEAIFMR